MKKTKTCPICQIKYTAERKTSQFCSAKCRKRNWLLKQASKLEPEIPKEPSEIEEKPEKELTLKEKYKQLIRSPFLTEKEILEKLGITPEEDFELSPPDYGTGRGGGVVIPKKDRTKEEETIDFFSHNYWTIWDNEPRSEKKQVFKSDYELKILREKLEEKKEKEKAERDKFWRDLYGY